MKFGFTLPECTCPQKGSEIEKDLGGTHYSECRITEAWSVLGLISAHKGRTGSINSNPDVMLEACALLIHEPCENYVKSEYERIKTLYSLVGRIMADNKKKKSPPWLHQALLDLGEAEARITTIAEDVRLRLGNK